MISNLRYSKYRSNRKLSFDLEIREYVREPSANYTKFSFKAYTLI